MSDQRPSELPKECLPEDRLLSRVVDRLATPIEWAELTSRAESNPALWQRLGETLRDECLLQAAVVTGGIASAPKFAAAEQGAASAGRRQHAPTKLQTDRVPQARPTRSRPLALEVIRSVGFAALGAALCLAWLRDSDSSQARPPQSVAAKHQPTASASAQLFARYLEQRSTEGGLVEQLPDLTLTSQATEDGQVEVLFLRRIVERAIVQDAWTLAIDEHGNPDPIRVPAIEAIAAANF